MSRHNYFSLFLHLSSSSNVFDGLALPVTAKNTIRPLWLVLEVGDNASIIYVLFCSAQCMLCYAELHDIMQAINMLSNNIIINIIG